VSQFDPLPVRSVRKECDIVVPNEIHYFLPIANGRTMEIKVELGAVTPEFEAEVFAMSDRCVAQTAISGAPPRPHLVRV
jgi:hypothetical protein